MSGQQALQGPTGIFEVQHVIMVPDGALQVYVKEGGHKLTHPDLVCLLRWLADSLEGKPAAMDYKLGQQWPPTPTHTFPLIAAVSASDE